MLLKMKILLIRLIINNRLILISKNKVELLLFIDIYFIFIINYFILSLIIKYYIYFFLLTLFLLLNDK